MRRMHQTILELAAGIYLEWFEDICWVDRTQAGGNIDTSTAIEQHVDAKLVAEFTKGSEITIQMHQVNGDGAGPYKVRPTFITSFV